MPLRLILRLLLAGLLAGSALLTPALDPRAPVRPHLSRDLETWEDWQVSASAIDRDRAGDYDEAS